MILYVPRHVVRVNKYLILSNTNKIKVSFATHYISYRDYKLLIQCMQHKNTKNPRSLILYNDHVSKCVRWMSGGL